MIIAREDFHPSRSSGVGYARPVCVDIQDRSKDSLIILLEEGIHCNSST